MNPSYNFSSSSSSFHFLDLNEPPHKPGHQQYGLIINNHAPLPHQQATETAAACPTFSSVTQDYQSGTHTGEYHQTQQKVDKKIYVPVKVSSVGYVSSASSYEATNEDNSKNHKKMVDHENNTSTNGHGSLKWMCSKMRVVRTVMPSNKFSKTDVCIPAKSSEIVRVCSDCNTTKTPLWRGGPHGPKSVSNACGISRRKSRKAMALAASAQNDSDNVSKMQSYSSTEAPKIHNAEKKLRTSYHDVTQCHQTGAVTLMNKKSTELFPGDEEEAAILLMALSCGLIHG